MLELTQQDGFIFDRQAGTNGGEHAGPCPFCGGEDRFRIWPEETETGRAWCRSCGWAGDGIQYLIDYHKMSFKDACNELSLDRPIKINQQPAAPKAFQPRTVSAPCSLWQQKAGAFLKYTQGCLFERPEILKWLHEARGLNDETIKAAGLGYNPEVVWREREQWGLEPEISQKTNKPKKLWIPVGLVIPYQVNDIVTRLRIRRPDADVVDSKDSRYIIVSGSAAGAMILKGNSKACVVVESELDGLLIAQDAGDLAQVIALGNAQSKPDTTAHEILTGAAQILCSLDSDQAGIKASWAFWNKTYPQVKRWPCVGGKDPGEMILTGISIRMWAEAGLNLPRPQPATEQEDNLIPLCLGVACNSAEYRQADGMTCLWCNRINRPVVELQECPKKYWRKDSNGYRLPDEGSSRVIFACHSQTGGTNESR